MCPSVYPLWEVSEEILDGETLDVAIEHFKLELGDLCEHNVALAMDMSTSFLDSWYKSR